MVTRSHVVRFEIGFPLTKISNKKEVLFEKEKTNMQMITKNHLEYINNELMNMDENTYSHNWIYEWNQDYLDQRFFTRIGIFRFRQNQKN